MIIKEGIKVSKFDKNRWVINTNDGRNFLINNSTYQLFQLLNNSQNIDEAYLRFKEEFNTTQSKAYFEKILQEKLAQFNILAPPLNSDTTHKKLDIHQYLKLRIELLNPKIAGLLAQPFRFLYTPSLFWILLTIVAVLNTFLFFATPIKNTLVDTNYVLVFVLLCLSMLVHEVGHISACANSRVKHGGIGFGFYYIFPVMYAEITNIWLANKQQRIIANLGGIFSQLWYSSLLYIIYYLTHIPAFLFAFSFIYFSSILQLNPFVRFDGYWLLSDLTGTPNLLGKSNQVLKRVFNYKLLKENLVYNDQFVFNLTISDILLLLYGIINTLFIFVYASFVIYNYHDVAANFPMILVTFLKKLVALNLTVADFKKEFFSVLIFYILGLKYIVYICTKYFSNHSLTRPTFFRKK